jgi:Lsr2
MESNVARKVVIEKVDDLDGSPAARTMRFGLEGVEYELDLNDENAAELTHWLENYISHARRITGRKRPTQYSSSNAAAVRQWALQHGIAVSARGRIPRQIAADYAASVNS